MQQCFIKLGEQHRSIVAWSEGDAQHINSVISVDKQTVDYVWCQLVLLVLCLPLPMSADARRSAFYQSTGRQNTIVSSLTAHWDMCSCICLQKSRQWLTWCLFFIKIIYLSPTALLLAK